MARTFNVNIQRLADYYAGFAMFELKEMAVSVGWTVVGSGDGSSRFAYNGVTSALPSGQQGSGGDYDCWMTGNTRTNSTPASAGDAGNQSAWIVIENAGRQILLVHTNQSGVGGSGWSGYGRMAYNPGTGVTPSFVGTSAGASTIPTAPTNESWLVGSRGNATGDPWLTYNSAGYVHIWGDSTPGAGGAATIGLVFARSSDSTVQRYMCFAAVDVGTEISGDADPTVAYCYTTVPSAGGCPIGVVWNPITTAMESLSTNYDGLSAPWRGQGNSVGGEDQLTQLQAICAINSGSRCCKGLITTSGLASSSTPRGWGDRGEDADGLGWVHLGNNGGLLMPWPSAATVPMP